VTAYTPAQLARLLGAAEPTPEQAAVIGAPLRPMAVIAGAGSGKSETMAARLVWLAASGMVRPERVLGLTFTRKAAAELAERVRGRLDGLRWAGLEPPGAGSGGWLQADPVIATYHAYAGRLVGDHALREAVEPSIRLITPAVAWQLAARVVAAYDGPMDAVAWTPSTVTAAVLDLSAELAEHMRAPADVLGVGEWLAARREELAAGGPQRVPAAAARILDCQRVREQMLPLVTAYAAVKAAREVMDYGDQMALAARIAERHPEVGAAERARYQVVLLDEYQDTSHAQLVLLRALFGGGHPVTAVGDPCQSIYGWRGASAGNLLRFTADFPVPGGRGAQPAPAPMLTLSTSFRNAGRVLDAAAAIQADLRAEAPDVPRLVPGPDRAARGMVTCALLDTVADEAEWVAAQAAALLGGAPGCAPDGRPWPDRRAAGVRPCDIAVLCRKRSQFVPLRRALEDRGIPVEVVGLGGLLAVPEVADVVATLRVLQDAGASDALARLLTGPRWRIGPRDMVALGRRARALARGDRDPDRGDRDPAPPDALAEAITDLTADAGSLVEALDDLGDPGAYSPAGYARMRALAAELRRLRAHAGRPLADLAAEVEHALGLDIEVAARPGADPAAARADLDAFIDVADAFAGEDGEPTLAAFLAYLTAAQQEEFGLETGRVGESDSVKLLTVHAAKGLQWPAVFVPGLAAGERSQVFPARPRLSTRWTDNPRLVPFRLRGDAADLPALRGLDGASLASFTAACAGRDLAEERRLMYVAATRAAFWLGCSGYWWGEGGSSRLGPSPFLEEVRASGAAQVAAWAPEPPPEAENPLLATVPAADWPATPAGRHHEAAREAAALVEAALQARKGGSPQAAGTCFPRPAGEARPGEPDVPRPAGDVSPGEGELGPGERALVDAWRRDAGLLLAERAQRRGDGAARVGLPGRLSVSSLVSLARDPAELARQVRRPMPRPPAEHARRGTAFHRWLEQRYGQQRLIDDSDLFEAGDDSPAGGLGELGELRERFERGEWAGRWPQAVEVPFETFVADRLVRGRIDAVFADSPEGGYDVVDWKTGRLPEGEAERRAAAVQLAAYRLAWAALAGVPVSAVRAAFYYVAHDLTVRPADLLDEAGLAALIEAVPPEQ
jgi:DNA helicase-2/ATP-dependent DNA helicase PcrA